MSNTEDPQERPQDINQIINGLERYNPEAVGPLENYLQQQCEQRFCDGNSNRVLLKLYVHYDSSSPPSHPCCLCIMTIQIKSRFLLPDCPAVHATAAHEVTFNYI